MMLRSETKTASSRVQKGNAFFRKLKSEFSFLCVKSYPKQRRHVITTNRGYH